MKNKILLIADMIADHGMYKIAWVNEEMYLLTLNDSCYGPYEEIKFMRGTELVICDAEHKVEVIKGNGIELELEKDREKARDSILKFITDNKTRIVRLNTNYSHTDPHEVWIENVEGHDLCKVYIRIYYNLYTGLWDNKTGEWRIIPGNLTIDTKDDYITAIPKRNEQHEKDSYTFDYDFNVIFKGVYKGINKIYDGLWEVRWDTCKIQLIKIEDNKATIISGDWIYNYEFYTEINKKYGILRYNDDGAKYRLVYKVDKKIVADVVIDNIDDLDIINEDEIKVGNEVIRNGEIGSIQARIDFKGVKVISRESV